jgi:hypothetical protein
VTAAHRFLPYVRQGFAAGFTNPDERDPVLPAQASLVVSLRVNDRADSEASVTVQPYGPGDVLGIDTRNIIRADPPRLAVDFEPNYLPLIEFDQPDFPWLFTPAGAGSQGRLRPWLCLAVVRRQEGVELRFEPGDMLPVLTIGPPARPGRELPPLEESWAWVHAQVVEAEPGLGVEAILHDRPERNLSRLLCPRRLEPDADYLACLVPTFEAGRLAGRGLDVPAEERAQLRPAWLSGEAAPESVALPVYYHWEFRAGPGGDFESLAGRLRPRPLPEGVGTRPLDVSDPGFGLPGIGTVVLEGALRPTRGPAPTPPPAEFQARLRELLNLAENRIAGADADPVVEPPTYGSLHAAQEVVPAPDEGPRWLRELNLDPALRAIAGLGTLVVRDQQEALMEAAWAQLGEASEATRLVDRLPLAEAVLGAFVAKRLEPMEPERVLQLTAPLHARVRMPLETLQLRVQRSRLADSAVSAPLRRTLRSRGPLARRLAPAAAPVAPAAAPVAPAAARLFFPALSQVAELQFSVLPTPVLVTPEQVASQVRRVTRLVTVPHRPHGPPRPPVSRRLRPDDVEPEPDVKPEPDVEPEPGVDVQPPEPPPATLRYLEAARALRDYFTPPPVHMASPLPELQLQAVKLELLAQLKPETTLPRRAFARISAAGDPVQPSADAEPADLARGVPSYAEPMYTGLRDLSQELLLPGADGIPADTVTLLEANRPFVEAYMVGLNHELARELLWREFPGRPRQTAFRTFWDTRGTGSEAEQLEPISDWDPAAALGDNMTLGTEREPLVLLVRGQLLLRYPDAIVYAQRAASPTSLGAEAKQPIFRGSLDPDVTFLGFDLGEDEARGDDGGPGWFFVLQEQPTAPRFGLDEIRAGPLASWNDLAWSDVGVAPGGHLRLADVSPAVTDPARWGFNAAHMAAIMRQRPARVAIHANLILPPKRVAVP